MQSLPIYNHRKVQNIYVKNAMHMQRSGQLVQINYGKNPNTLSTHTKTTNKKNRSSIIKWLILLLMLFAALYFYRDSLHDIFEGVKALSAKTICVTFLFSFVYFITEGLIITIMAKPFSASFHFYNGVSTAYICEFYRLLTLGSGAGIAELYYLQKGGVSYPNGIGISMLQFVMKKIGIMTFGVIGFFFLLQRPVTKEVLHSYYGAMAGGCVVTILIVAALLIVTLSDAVKNLFLRILERIGNKFVTYQEKLEKLSENLILLNAAGKEVLTHKLRFLVIILLNLFKFFAIYADPCLCSDRTVYALCNGGHYVNGNLLYACRCPACTFGYRLLRICLFTVLYPFCQGKYGCSGYLSIPADDMDRSVCNRRNFVALSCFAS